MGWGLDVLPVALITLLTWFYKNEVTTITKKN